jgi:hypothetical protein
MSSPDPTADLAAAFQEVDALPTHLRSIFGNWRALRKFVDFAEAKTVRTAELLYAEPAPRPGTHSADIRHYLASPEVALLGTARAALEAVERSPLLGTARDLIEPILANIADARLREAQVRHQIGLAQQQHAAALADATAEALEAAKSAPRVAEAFATITDAINSAPLLAAKSGLSSAPPPEETDEEALEKARIALMAPGDNGAALDRFRAAERRIHEKQRAEAEAERPIVNTRK